MATWSAGTRGFRRSVLCLGGRYRSGQASMLIVSIGQGGLAYFRSQLPGLLQAFYKVIENNTNSILGDSNDKFEREERSMMEADLIYIFKKQNLLCAKLQKCLITYQTCLFKIKKSICMYAKKSQRTNERSIVYINKPDTECMYATSCQ